MVFMSVVGCLAGFFIEIDRENYYPFMNIIPFKGLRAYIGYLIPSFPERTSGLYKAISRA